MTPKDYYENIVKTNISVYMDCERKISNLSPSGDSEEMNRVKKLLMAGAYNAAVSLNHVSDYVFEEYYETEKIAERDIFSFRKYLGKTVSEDIVLLNEIANAFKHHRLRGGKKVEIIFTRPVRGSDNIKIGKSEWGELPWGEFKFGGEEQVSIHLESGKKRGLYRILKNVESAWDGIFSKGIY
ncbi:hypothetical protein [Azospirillum cavernae]|uniref:hypothetical protein n=1 Tax=Azospirillum cavernae TaxID=2320860 RepID=UPI0011C3CCA6|nr:hypothetical protein [Azospirillum cavernae]